MRKEFKIMCYTIGTAIGLAIALWFYTGVYLLDESSIPYEVTELGSINFDEIVSGEWNNIVIVRPYTPTSEIQEQYDINYQRLSNKTIQYADNQILLIFCDDNKVESYFYLPYQIATIDFDTLPTSLRIERANATFVVEYDNDVAVLLMN